MESDDKNHFSLLTNTKILIVYILSLLIGEKLYIKKR